MPLLRFCSLSASSKGNCYILQSEDQLLCIDLGISWKKIKDFLAKEQLLPSQIIGACISHEHNDHARGIPTFQKELSLPVHCNFYTAEALCEIYATALHCKIFTNEEKFILGPFSITPFGLAHDASDPVGFRVVCGSYQLAICTDLGFIHPGITHYLRDLDALVIESNHDIELVKTSQRPDLYKQRVLSRCGHISNKECARLLTQIYTSRLKNIVLAHLSEDCNDGKLALEESKHSILLAQQKLGFTTHCEVSLAPPSTPSEWIVLEK